MSNKNLLQINILLSGGKGIKSDIIE